MQIEMSIKGLMVDPISNMPIVILRDKDGQKTLPIWVGMFEANAIALPQIENTDYVSVGDLAGEHFEIASSEEAGGAAEVRHCLKRGGLAVFVD